MRLCPTGCGSNVKPGHFMCATCWAVVPKPLQGEVNLCWEVYRRAKGKSASISEILASYSNYRKAAEAATAAAR